MSKKQKRDKAYYEERLIREHPEIYTDMVDGKYSNITDAALAAGLKTKRTRLHEMKNAWGKATRDEQREFLRWLHADIKTKLPVTPLSASMPIAHDRKLLPDAIARVKDIMSKRRLKLGNVMDEMGFIRLDTSLGMALRQKTRLQPEMIAALEKWLAANSFV